MKLDAIKTFFNEYGRETKNKKFLDAMQKMDDAELETMMMRIALHVLTQRILLRRIYAFLCEWRVIEHLNASEFDDVPIERIITDTVDDEKTRQFLDMVERRYLEFELMEPEEQAEEIRRIDFVEAIENARAR